MKKVNLKLSELTKNRGRKNCISINKEVNDFTTEESTKKVNTLDPCNNNCEDFNANLPIITSPFEAYKLNTANDGISAALKDGTDSIWEAGEGTPTSLPSIWNPAFVHRNRAWVASPFSNANWISNNGDARHSGNKDIYFKVRFNLSLNADPTLFYLDMDFYADNAVQEIYVNGVAQSSYSSLLPQASSSPYNYVGFQKGKQIKMKLENDWKTCENEIIVHVKSGSPFVGFLAQNSSMCLDAKFPYLSPHIEIKWGDSDCDCVETDDYEVFYISIQNPYHNLSFKNFTIQKIRVVDKNGNPVDLLPDGTDSIELVPIGPYCFGEIGECSSKNNSKVFRQFVLNNRGAKPGDYKIILEGICFEVCESYSLSQCYNLSLCSS